MTHERSAKLMADCCHHVKKLRHTKALHARLLRTRVLFTSLHLHANLFLSYAACPNTHLSLPNLLKSMDATNSLPWNALVARLSQRGLPLQAIETTCVMHKTGLYLDTYSLCSSISAAAVTRMLKFGLQVHGYVVKSGWMGSVYVGGPMIDFYAKLGCIEESAKVFDEMPVTNMICVNALLSGFADAGLWAKGLELFYEIYKLNLMPDPFTLSAILRVCAGLSAVELGRQVHATVIRKSETGETDCFLLSSLIEMYGKCGLEDKARKVFDEANKYVNSINDVVLWTSLLSAYGRNGKFGNVIEVFEMMLKDGIRPDNVAFVAVLSACGHTGHVASGVQYFESMARDFGIFPEVEHYGCLVDMLCKAGELEQAWKVVNKMPVREDHCSGSITAWGTLLNACEVFGNLEMGKLAAERALKLQPDNDGIYVMLSNLYAKFGMWDEIEELREVMKQRGLRKDVGCSWI